MSDPKFQGYELEPYDSTYADSFDKGPVGLWHPIVRRTLTGKDDGSYDDRPLICECGNDSFRVFYPRDYHTSVQCTKCGSTNCVHSG